MAPGRSRPDPLWLTALLGAAAMLLAGFLLYLFTVAASAMEFKHSKGAGPMRKVCRATAGVLIAIPLLCVVSAVLDRRRTRRGLAGTQAEPAETFDEAPRVPDPPREAGNGPGDG